MTKKEIVRDIAERMKLTQLECKEIVQMVFDSVIQTLVESPDHRIELRNFGVFEVKRRKARIARNPKTNERVPVPPKSVVIFKPGKRMEQLVAPIEDVPMLSHHAARNADLDEEELAEPVGAGTGRRHG